MFSRKYQLLVSSKMVKSRENSCTASCRLKTKFSTPRRQMISGPIRPECRSFSCQRAGKEGFALEREATLMPASGTTARKAVALLASLASIPLMHRAWHVQGRKDMLVSLGDPHSAPS